MIETQDEKRSLGMMVLAGIAALLITTLVFAGYTLLRKRHAEGSASLNPAPGKDAPKIPKALVLVDEALIQSGNTTIGGTVKNTSNEKLEQLLIELELRRRKDALTETKLISLDPTSLDPQQEGRYSLQLRAQDYSSAKLVSLKVGNRQVPLPYTSAQGQKRPLERLETKTVIVGGKPTGKQGGEFLNSPDNPARVP